MRLMKMKDYLTNPTGSYSSYFTRRSDIIELLNFRYMKLIKKKMFTYEMYIVGKN